MDSIRDARLIDCAKRLADLIKEEFPDDAERLGDEGIDAVVELGIERSRGNEKVTERDMFLYITVMLMLGSYFDEDPQMPWAKTLLDSGASMESLHERVHRHLDEVVGNENEFLVRALVACRSLELNSFPDPATSGFKTRVLKMLEALYPRKFESQGVNATLRMVNEAVEVAAEYQMKPGAALLATLAFMLGSGFHIDPVHPWIQKILLDESLDGEAKTKSLHEESLGFVEHSLSSDVHTL